MEESHKRHRARTLWLLGLLHALTHVYSVALLPLYLQIQHGLNLSSVELATLLVTLMGLAYMLPSYGIGMLADRFSRKRLLTIGLVVNSVGFMMLGFAPVYPVAMAGAVLAGLGGSFYHPAATALVARLFPDGRGRALGLLGVGAGVGFFLGPVYCGWRAASCGSWRVPVIEIGVLGLLGAALFQWLADEERPVGRQCDSDCRRPLHPTALFPSGKIWLFFLAATLILSLRDFAGQAVGTSASLFLQKAYGFSSWTAGLTLSTVFVMSAFSNPLFGHLSDQGRLKWASLVMFCGAGFVALVPWLPVVLVIPAFLCYGFFFMANYPIIEAWLMESVPDAVRGRVLGLFMTVGGLIGNISHWAVGSWVENLGVGARTQAAYRSLFAVLGAMILCSMMAFPFLRAMRKAEQESQPGMQPIRE